jgi:hypothetical protein
MASSEIITAADSVSQAQPPNAIAAKLDDIKTNKRNYWKAEEENILASWSDKGQCYEWMHYRAHASYKKSNAWFTIPVIIISTITGTANFAQDRFDDSYKSWVVMGVGGMNIIAGIITTIYQFLKISELNEAHRVAALSWGKFCRNLKAELAKHPLDRVNHEHFVALAKEEYDRLIEISPSIPANIVKDFNKRFKKAGEFIRPEVCADKFGTDVFKMDELERRAMIDELLADQTAKDREKDAELDELRNMLREKEAMVAAAAAAAAEMEKDKGSPVSRDEQFELFKETFAKINGRYPNEREVSTMFLPLYGNNKERETMITFDGDSIV